MKSITNQSFVLVSSKEWHIKEFHNEKKNLHGEWFVIRKKEDLNYENLQKINPRYIFFPHWSHLVSEEITNNFECVCFHETDLPFGRGGSPIQNLINKGYEKTKITALRMTKDLDAGPIYLKKDFSLLGLAEEIYIRSAKTIIQMIKEIIINNPIPKKQTGEVLYFKRRNPQLSYIKDDLKNIDQLFDFIRMLDSDGYPKAKLETNNFIFEFSRPALRIDAIEASVRIKLK